MTTLVHKHPEQYLHKSRFTRYLQYFRDGGPSYMMMMMVMVMVMMMMMMMMMMMNDEKPRGSQVSARGGDLSLLGPGGSALLGWGFSGLGFGPLASGCFGEYIPALPWLHMTMMMLLAPLFLRSRSRSSLWILLLTTMVEDSRPQWGPPEGHQDHNRCTPCHLHGHQLQPRGQAHLPDLTATVTQIVPDVGRCWKYVRAAGASSSACRGHPCRTAGSKPLPAAPLLASPPAPVRPPVELLRLTPSRGRRQASLWEDPAWRKQRVQYRMELLATQPGLSSRSQGAKVGALRRKLVGSTWHVVQQMAHRYLTESRRQHWANWEFQATHERRPRRGAPAS